MSSRSGEAVLSSKVKLGADAAAAAGPKGRDAAAATDVTLRAEILTYSRSRGLFAGISLEGSTLRPDKNGNKDLYGKDVTPKDIVLKGAVPAPPAAQELLSTLNSKTPKAKAAD
jgi:lipid-binding SYLF domain-containing protein